MTKEQRQKLFDHMSNEHGITLLESQIDDIADIILPPKPYPYTLGNEPELKWVVEITNEEIMEWSKEYSGDMERQAEFRVIAKFIRICINSIP